MDVNTSYENKYQVIESEFNILNISNNYSNSINTNHKNCCYCNKPSEELWCKDCALEIIEGWTSGNPDIDKFIRDTMHNVRNVKYPEFLEWVPFDKFIEVEEIGEGGFAKVYTATWMDGPLYERLEKQSNGSWNKLDPQPMKVALKRLNGSQKMSNEYLNEVYFPL